MTPTSSTTSRSTTSSAPSTITLTLPLDFEKSTPAIRQSVFRLLINQYPGSYRQTAQALKFLYCKNNLDELNKFIQHFGEIRGKAPQIETAVVQEMHALGLTLCQFSDGTLHMSPNPSTLVEGSRAADIDEVLAGFLEESPAPAMSTVTSTSNFQGPSPLDIIQAYDRPIAIHASNEDVLSMMLKSNSIDSGYLISEAYSQGKSDYLTTLLSKK